MITPVLPTYARAQIAFERGEGPFVYSSDGETFLDFGAGVAVNSLGHAHPQLVRALGEQAAKLWHTSNLYRIPGQEKLAQRLTQVTFADTVFFNNSGAEAVETAVKMARKYHACRGDSQKFRLITFEGAFHGRTLATIAAGGQEKYLEGFGPKTEGFDQVALGDLNAVRAAVTDETAGILIEPIQGEGGIRVAENSFLRGLRQICDEYGLLLVLDEIQCGMGRTGKLFAHEWAGIQPDIMAVAKALGGGFPVGACLATESAASGMVAGTHGSTFGGNPLAMAVGNAVLDVVTADGFLENVLEVSTFLRQQLARIVDENEDIFEELRGEGLMLGLKCKIPNGDVVNALIGQKLLTIGAGENVLRLLPPLIISREHINTAITKIEAACKLLRESQAKGVA